MSNTTTVVLAAMAAAFFSSAYAAWVPPPKDSRVSADLIALAREPSAALRSNAIASGDVVIDTAASGDPEALATDLRALGARKVTVFGRVVSAVVPRSSIPALNSLSSLQLARPSYSRAMVGDVTSQGDAAVRSDLTRTAFGIDGTGVMVGTLSDSYDCLGGASAGVAAGDLPPGTRVIEEGPCGSFSTDEGRAMMEIISDVAPGVRHAFHTAYFGHADFAQGILALAGAGATIINDDIIYLDEPFYQDGIIAQAIDLVKARGVAYFSAAGNNARQSYEAPFRPSNLFFDYGKGPAEAHDFDPGPGVDVCMNYTLPQGEGVAFVYQWDQPFFSVSGPPGSASDMDILYLTNCDVSSFGGSFNDNIGRDPVEVAFQSDLIENKFGLMLLRIAGPAPGLMKFVVTGSAGFTFDEFATKTGASWGHSGARGGLAVGASPVFSGSPPRISSYSSAGGSPILFDTAGNRLSTPDVRQQPDIITPTGVDTTFFGGEDTDGSGFPNFGGTSAAAPHAAGIAALMKELVPSLTPDAMYAALKSTAIDMDDPITPGFDIGFDFGTGFGFVQADRALNAIAPTPAPIPPEETPSAPTEPVPEPAPPTTPLPPAGPIPPTITLPVPVSPPPGPSGRTASCRGRTATIIGTDSNEIIIGTPGPDVIHGFGGRDVIRGGGGNDVICGGDGRDRLFGGGGRDVLIGGSGLDRCTGGTGRDKVRC
jgi:Ca2+-binding RTX toxin-like protein